MFSFSSSESLEIACGRKVCSGLSTNSLHANLINSRESRLNFIKNGYRDHRRFLVKVIEIKFQSTGADFRTLGRSKKFMNRLSGNNWLEMIGFLLFQTQTCLNHERASTISTWKSENRVFLSDLFASMHNMVSTWRSSRYDFNCWWNFSAFCYCFPFHWRSRVSKKMFEVKNEFDGPRADGKLRELKLVIVAEIIVIDFILIFKTWMEWKALHTRNDRIPTAHSHVSPFSGEELNIEGSSGIPLLRLRLQLQALTAIQRHPRSRNTRTYPRI